MANVVDIVDMWNHIGQSQCAHVGNYLYGGNWDEAIQYMSIYYEYLL